MNSDITNAPQYPAAVGWPRLKYTSNEELVIFHSVSTYGPEKVEVVGNDGGASYEWGIRKDGVIIKHSDDGYGCSGVAMRDGLLVALGEVGEAVEYLKNRGWLS